MMKQSFYNFIFPYRDTFFAYNILSTSLIELEESTYSALRRDNIDSIDFKLQEELKEEGFIVEDTMDERALYRYHYDHLRLFSTAGVFKIIFIPSYNCNLRCPYCYEGNEKNVKKISLNEIDAIVHFMESEIQSSASSFPVKKIIASLFGGEPLLFKKEIEYFCEKVSELAKKYSVNLVFDMTSNFVLVDTTTIDFLKKYKVTTQVSIDGPKKDHDIRRVTANKKGTYDIIVKNLKTALNAGLKDFMTIRINIDANNIDDVEPVFNEMLNYSNDVYFGVLTQYRGYNDGYENQCIEEKDVSEELSRKIDILYKKYNLPIPQRFGRKAPCSLNSEKKFIVDCNLDVYKCDLLINKKECTIGKLNLDGSLELNSGFYKQMVHSPFNFTKCYDCKFLPLCSAGCVAKTYLNEGRKDGEIRLPHCDIDEKEFLKKMQSYIDLMYSP